MFIAFSVKSPSETPSIGRTWVRLCWLDDSFYFHDRLNANKKECLFWHLPFDTVMFLARSLFTSASPPYNISCLTNAPYKQTKTGLYDYPKIIKHPMDLSTVKKNIVDRKYKTLQAANEDVTHVWKNCMTYNADGSDFFILAQTLNKKWQEKFKKLLDDFQVAPLMADSSAAGGGGVGGNSKLTLDEKRAFAKSLYKISKDELGRVLVEIEKNYPAALTRNAAEDEIEFNVDRLPSALFTVRERWLCVCVCVCFNLVVHGAVPHLTLFLFFFFLLYTGIANLCQVVHRRQTQKEGQHWWRQQQETKGIKQHTVYE